jgi:hypothetical protein
MTNDINEQKLNNLLDKVDKVKGRGKLDLSSDEDLSIAIMNLISIEEHLFFTAQKTGKTKYLPILKEVREMRKVLLKKIIKDYEGEVWCISKHLLAAAMRLEEVGTKSLGQGKETEAWDLFKMAYQLYSLFWGINLGVVDNKGIKADLSAMGFKEKEFVNSQEIVDKTKGSLFDKMGALVKKAIDCCIE